MARPLSSHPGGNRLDLDTDTFVAHTLRAEGFDASEDGTGRGTPLVPVPVDPQNTRAGGVVSGTIDTTSPGRGGGQAVMVSVSYAIRADAMREGTAKTPSADAEGKYRLRDPGMGISDGIAPTIDCGAPHAVAYQCHGVPAYDPSRTGFTRTGDSIPDGTWERLLERSERSGDCLLWTGAKNDGYGVIRLNGRTIATHLVSFGIHKGVPASGMEVDHLCRNRACFNPDHLEAVPPLVNNHRSPLTNASREVCKNGHPLRGNNVYSRKDRPGRGCVICRTAKNRKIPVEHFTWEECVEGVRILSPLPVDKGPQGNIPYATNVGPMGTLRAGDGGLTSSGIPFVVNAAESCATRSHARPSEVARCLDSTGSFAAQQGGTVVAAPMAVRRLTPVEYERLQGFPDGWTAIPWRGKPADQCPDGPRYKALGNSMAVPVMRWIGERIEEVRRL